MSNPTTPKQQRQLVLALTEVNPWPISGESIRTRRSNPAEGIQKPRALRSTPPLTCDMTHDCTDPVTHIGSNGYVYCKLHAIRRRQSGWERTRQMLKRELLALEAGETLTYRKETV